MLFLKSIRDSDGKVLVKKQIFHMPEDATPYSVNRIKGLALTPSGKAGALDEEWEVILPDGNQHIVDGDNQDRSFPISRGRTLQVVLFAETHLINGLGQSTSDFQHGIEGAKDRFDQAWELFGTFSELGGSLTKIMRILFERGQLSV